MAYGRGASTSDAAQRGSTRAPMEEAMPIAPQGIIDNTFHPIDSGLEATDDHWGTEAASAAENASKIKDTPRRRGRPAIGNGNE